MVSHVSRLVLSRSQRFNEVEDAVLLSQPFSDPVTYVELQ